jgi:hypothetical protein
MQCRQSTAERITTHAASGHPTPKMSARLLILLAALTRQKTRHIKHKSQPQTDSRKQCNAVRVQLRESQPTLQQVTQHRKLSARLLSCTYAAKYKAQKSYNKTTDRPNKKAELIALISGSTILQARPQTPHGTALRVPASAGTRLDP